jgi:hypothetical protein
MSALAWRRRPDVLWRRTTESVVVLPGGVDEPLVLSGAAALFWDVLDVATGLDDAVELLAFACHVPPDDVRAQIVPLAATLADAGAVEATEDAC